MLNLRKAVCIIIAVVILSVSNGVSYFLGGHHIFRTEDTKTGEISFCYYSTEEMLAHERAYCNAWIELCHKYLYQNAITSTDPQEEGNYWLDVVSEGDEYAKIDSINGGDWEDFNYHWDD